MHACSPDAAIDMGVALTLHVRADRQRPAPGADQAPAPHSPSSASAFLNDIVRQSGSRLPWMVVMRWQNCTWRTSPFMRAKGTRRWHISKSTSRGVCNGDVALAPGVGKRGARTRRCSRAAVRFYSADHQKMASKKAALGGSLRMGRHKDICGVLRTIKETSWAGYLMIPPQWPYFLSGRNKV